MKKGRTIIVLSLILLSFVSNSYARRTPSLRPGRQESIPDLGIKLKVFKKLKPVPLSTPKAMTLISTNGRTGEKRKITAYSKHELWMMSQTVAKWENPKIGSISVFSPKYPPANEIKYIFKKLIKKEAFDKWVEQQKGGVDLSTEERQLEWMKEAFGDSVEKTNFDKKSPIKKNSIKGFEIIPFVYNSDDGTSNKQLYLFKAKKNRPSFILAYSYNEIINEKKAMKAIYGSIKSIKVTAVKQSVAVSKDRGKVNKNETPEFRASRERAIRSIKNSKGWWYLTTPNYVIASNLKDRNLIKKIKKNIELARAAYQKYYPIKQKINAISVIKVFKDRDTYLAYVGDEYKWTGGLWMAAKKELVISPLSFKASRKLGQTNILTTLYHEGFHQYLHYAINERMSSVWFNEGSAQFFEGLILRNKTSIGIQKFYLAKMLRTPLHVSADRINELLGMSYPQFYNKSKRRKNYTLAFAIVYYLWKGAPSVKNNNYSEIIPKYYDALASGKPAAEATQLAWYGVDMEKFASDLNKFWQKKRSIKHSIKFTPKVKQGKNH